MLNLFNALVTGAVLRKNLLRSASVGEHFFRVSKRGAQVLTSHRAPPGHQEALQIARNLAGRI
jgi:hypothetical protein